MGVGIEQKASPLLRKQPEIRPTRRGPGPLLRAGVGADVDAEEESSGERLGFDGGFDPNFGGVIRCTNRAERVWKKRVLRMSQPPAVKGAADTDARAQPRRGETEGGGRGGRGRSGGAWYKRVPGTRGMTWHVLLASAGGIYRVVAFQSSKIVYQLVLAFLGLYKIFFGK